jgi:hypothetical protein
MFGRKGYSGEAAFVPKKHIGVGRFVPKMGSTIGDKGVLSVIHNVETKKNYLEKKK